MVLDAFAFVEEEFCMLISEILALVGFKIIYFHCNRRLWESLGYL